MPGGIRFTSMGGQGGGFQGQDPHVIFSQFFGTNNPFAAFGGMDEMMGGPGGLGGAAFHGMGGGGIGAGGGQQRQKQEPIKRQLNCTLEELYTGTTKKVKITRQRLTADGKSTRSEEKILEIPIRPGWKKGTTVTFEKEGDEAPGVVPQDIQFVVAEKEHARFTREGDNLIHVVRLPLADALCGSTLTLATLDGRTLSIPISEVVSPGYIKNIAYEGMPISKEQGKRGDLILRFNIVFPHFVSDSKKLQLRNLLV
jgi:DnaJ family protein B protein 4